MVASGVLDEGIGVAVLLHASGLGVQFLFHKTARFIQDVLVAGELVEPLPVVAVPVQLDVLVVLVLATLRLHHLKD